MAGKQLQSQGSFTPPPWKQGEDAALALRHRLRLGDGQVDVWSVIRQSGVSLVFNDFGPDGGDGRYLHKDGRALIFINEAVTPASRRRFTAAHELGHHEMHRFGTATTVMRDDDIFGSKEPVEVAANAFAASFLAPAAGLRQQLGEKPGASVTVEDVIELIRVFGLSFEATVYRLNNVGVISGAQKTALLAAGRGRVFRLLADAGIDEEESVPAGQRLPATYVTNVERMWRERVISDQRFAEMLRLEEEDADEWRAARDIARPDLPEFDEEAASVLLDEIESG